MNSRDAAAEQAWKNAARQQRPAAQAPQPMQPIQHVYVVGSRDTAARELVGCLKFVIIVVVLVPLLLILAAMVWSAFTG